MKNIIYTGGYWSTNIGNAFYDLGCLYLLNEILPNDNIVFASDQSGCYWTKFEDKKVFNYLNKTTPDYLVISGPLLNINYPMIWEETLIQLKKSDCKIILLSAGCSEYNEHEKSIISSFLKKYHHHALFTRDAETFNLYKNYFDISYNGICCAFFIPNYFKPYEIKINPYVIYSFESYKEVQFSEKIKKNKIEFNGKTYFFDDLEYKNKISKIFLQKKVDRKLGVYDIIRTSHQTHNNVSVITKKYLPNTYISDIPFDYLNIYSHAEAVFTDRVHACVAALAFNKPSMLFSSTPRSKLLERVGIIETQNKLMMINQEFLSQEKQKLMQNLKMVFE